MDSTPASLSPSCHPPPQDCLYSSCLFSCWQTWGFHLRHLTSPPGSAPFPEFSPSERNEKTISRDPQDACCDSSLRPSLWQGTRSELSGERMLGLSKECWPIREAEKQVLRGVHGPAWDQPALSPKAALPTFHKTEVWQGEKGRWRRLILKLGTSPPKLCQPSPNYTHLIKTVGYTATIFSNK